MLKKIPYQAKGFTILEVLVSTIILALVLTGIVNVFISGKRWILHSRERMSAGELGKLFLAPLQMGVRADTWGAVGNLLQLTVSNPGGLSYCDGVSGHTQQPGCPSLPDRTLDNIAYSAQYNITNVTTRTEPNNIRRVVTTVSWNEPTQ